MAARFLVPGGDGQWNSTTNWSATSGGASGASFPVAADTVTFDINSANAPMTVNVASACLSFTASNYTGTLTVSNTLTVSGTTNTGNITLSAGMTITGTGTIIKKPTGTTGVITSNGVVLDCNFQYTGIAASTTTLTGNLQVNKNVTFSLNSTAINTINSGTLIIGGDLIMNSPIDGTSTIQMIGSTTATITPVALRFLNNNLVINKTGILNLTNLYFGGTSGRTLTYTAGVVNHTGTLFTNRSILNTNGINWNNISQTTTTVITLTSLLTAVAFVGIGTSTTFNGTVGFIIGTVTIPSVVHQAALNLANGVTYRITSGLTHFGTGSGINIMGHLRCISGIAYLILNTNATCKLAFINITNIDATGGKTLRVIGLIDGDINKGATVTNCVNCVAMFNKIEQYNKVI